MTQPAVYHFKSRDLDFVTVGHCEKWEGLYMVRVGATVEQGQQVQRALTAGLDVAVMVEVNREILLPSKISRVLLRPEGVGRVEMAAIVG